MTPCGPRKLQMDHRSAAGYAAEHGGEYQATLAGWPHDRKTRCCAVQAELEAEKTLALNSHKTADRLKRELDIAVTDKLRAQEEVRCNTGPSQLQLSPGPETCVPLCACTAPNPFNTFTHEFVKWTHPLCHVMPAHVVCMTFRRRCNIYEKHVHLFQCFPFDSSRKFLANHRVDGVRSRHCHVVHPSPRRSLDPP